MLESIVEIGVRDGRRLLCLMAHTSSLGSKSLEDNGGSTVKEQKPVLRSTVRGLPARASIKLIERLSRVQKSHFVRSTVRSSIKQREYEVLHFTAMVDLLLRRGKGSETNDRLSEYCPAE